MDHVSDPAGVPNRRPLAYFLTWSTYGHRLHGDRRGSVDSDHNEFATPYYPRDELREDAARRRMASPPFPLSAPAQRIVNEVIVDHAAIRSWNLLAHDAMSTHVHVVVDAAEHSPEAMMGQFKSWATRRLREAGLAGGGRLWARHGSTRYLWDGESIRRAVRYVAERQRLPFQGRW